NSANSDLGVPSSASAMSGALLSSDTSSLSALTLPSSPASLGNIGLGGDLLWTGSDPILPPVGAMHLSAPDGVAGAALSGGGAQGLPFTMAGSDPLLLAGGNALVGSLQSDNQHLTCRNV